MNPARVAVPLLSSLLLAACPGPRPQGQPDGGELPTCSAAITSGNTAVGTVAPADQETRVLRTPTLSLTFTGAELGCANFASAKVTLLQDGQPVGLGTPTCAPRLVTVEPAQQLALGTRYTVRFEGLFDWQGQALPGCQSSFTTKSKTVAISGAAGGAISLDEDGTVWAWGADGSIAQQRGPRQIPVKVALGGKAVAIDLGDKFAVALLEDGTAWSWGDNTLYLLGQGSADRRTALPPGKVALPAGVRAKAVSVAPRHALLLGEDGKVYAWGVNDVGEVGDGTLTPRTTADLVVPTEVLGLSNVVAVAAGSGGQGNGAIQGSFSLAVKSDGTAWAWGANNSGQLGVAIVQPPKYPTPIQVPGVANARSVVGGFDHGYAVTADGRALGWGNSLAGSLGNGHCHEGELPPMPVITPAGSGELDQVVSVAGGRWFGLAVRGDGTMYGWGANGEGALGDGTTGQMGVFCSAQFPADNYLQKVPEQVPGMAGVVAVSASLTDNSGFALRDDSTVWAAGYNTNNKLGLAQGSATQIKTYAQVPGL